MNPARDAFVVTAMAALVTLTGCNSGNGSAPDAGNPPPHTTYWRDVAPILNAHCIGCHTAGGIGPMPLTTYDEASPVAALIAQVTARHEMPPWPPTSNGCRPLQDPRTLSPAQIDALAGWAEDGAPEGEMSTYVAPTPQGGRALPPTGDLAVQPDAAYAPHSSDGNDDYHCFVMDPHLTTSRDVIGVRVTPGDARVVHHVILYEVRASAVAELQRLDDNDPGPGYSCFGGSGVTVQVGAAPAGSDELASFNQQGIAGWAPGGVPTYFPEGTGIRLATGSRLVMQVHYNLANVTGDTTDQTRVDLYFSPQPVASPALFSPMYNDTFRIPAGARPDEAAGRVDQSNYAITPVRLFGLTPHMHLLGREIRMDVQHPDGTTECLIDIPNWNFHWQQSYWLTQPMDVRAGLTGYDLFKLTCTYDNTAANQPVVAGVQQSPQELRWGENSSDEMCLNFFYVAR